jgi:acylphosphatase
MLAFVVLLAMSADPPAPEKLPVGRTVFYSGKVQGVGFRAAAAEIAKDHPVTGWVKNIDDGRVQLVVEGPPDAVDKFLKAVRTRWKDNIEKEESEDRKPTGEFKRFEIAK